MIQRNNEIKALYIHVPFCNHICAYCDFPKLFYYPSFADQYLVTLEKQLANDLKYTSIYIGGGTPTSLNLKQFDLLLQLASRHSDQNASLCIEVNPENCDEEKVKLMAKFGVNRVSIGVQTFSQHQLSILNRHHNQEQVEQLIRLLIKSGITDISCDLIYGLPKQSLKDLELDLSIMMKLPIKHISTYPLMIEEHTSFKIKQVMPAKDEIQLKMYRLINRYLKKYGFQRYEISNFSLPGYESKHNLVYWRNQNYCGVGPGSSGYENGIRYNTSRNFTNYFKGIIIKEEQIISDKDYLIEYIMLKLRTSEGILLSEYRTIFGNDLVEEFEKPLCHLLDSGLIIMDSERLKISEKGIFIENYIISELIKHL